MEVEIHTTIRNGLPVMARGRYKPGANYIPEPGGGIGVICPGWSECVEDIEIFWRKMPRRAIPAHLITPDDEERIEGEMTEQVRYRSDW